jgi:CHAT domain-containing protein
VVLQYLIGYQVLTVFVVTKTNFKTFRQPLDSSFFKNVETYRHKLISFSYDDMRDSSIRSFARQSHDLYTLLLGKAAPYLQGKNLVIIPDNVLTQLPFETLVTELPKTTKKPGYRDLAYLIKTHPVSYDYSATLFVMNGGHESIKNPTLLAMAPSYKNLKIPDISQKDVLAMRGDTGNISTISGTYNEVNSIRKIFGGKSLIKSDATEEKFKKMALNYDVLHLAMHGMVNNEYPMFSKLVFTHAGDSANEGFLNTYEIYNLKINAALVVLSACNSGSGKLYNGEGIISLARGFFTAGAKSVVMTLWSIADKTSQRLMTSFYSNLGDRLSISDALQKAKTDYITNSDALMAHPYFWAGFIVTGNSTTTFEVTKSKNQVYWGTLGILMFCLAGYAGWKWKNR